MLQYIKLWNEWRKHLKMDSSLYKVAVLFGLIKSPSFEYYKLCSIEGYDLESED